MMSSRDARLGQLLFQVSRVMMLVAWMSIFVLLVVNAKIPRQIVLALTVFILVSVTVLFTSSIYQSRKNKEERAKHGVCLEDMIRDVREAELLGRALDQLLKRLCGFEQHFLWRYRAGLLIPDTKEFKDWQAAIERCRALRGWSETCVESFD